MSEELGTSKKVQTPFDRSKRVNQLRDNRALQIAREIAAEQEALAEKLRNMRNCYGCEIQSPEPCMHSPNCEMWHKDRTGQLSGC